MVRGESNLLVRDQEVRTRHAAVSCCVHPPVDPDVTLLSLERVGNSRHTSLRSTTSRVALVDEPDHSGARHRRRAELDVHGGCRRPARP